MKLKLLIALTFFTLISGNVFAQQNEAAKLPSPDEIFAKYVTAIGGREANEKIKTRVKKGTIEMTSPDASGYFLEYTAAPNKRLTVLNILGVGEIKVSFDGETAWGSTPNNNIRIYEGEELQKSKFRGNFYLNLNLDKNFTKWEVKGIEKVGSRDAYKLVGTPEELDPETYYFDTQNGLLLQLDTIVNSPQGKITQNTFYEDIREVGGVKVPFKIHNVKSGAESTIIFSQIENNVEIGPGKFTKPQ